MKFRKGDAVVTVKKIVKLPHFGGGVIKKGTVARVLDPDDFCFDKSGVKQNRVRIEYENGDSCSHEYRVPEDAIKKT